MKIRKFQLMICAFFIMSCTLFDLVAEPIHFSPITPNQATSTVLVTLPAYNPEEPINYLAQPGDTLPALAVHFNTTEAEIRAFNPEIPENVTTLSPGLPMKMPNHYLPIWGSPFQILPDNTYINGPLSVNFKTGEFIALYPGWLKDHRSYAGGLTRSGAEIIDLVALNFSISPKILLTLLEFQTHALTDPYPPESKYLLGYEDTQHEGLYLQLVWAANILNNGYYGWRSGHLATFVHPEGRFERPDPRQNAATVAIQVYFMDKPDGEFNFATGPDGMAKTFKDLFGDPWVVKEPHIPENLQQPFFRLPFQTGDTWSFTGGPHSGWGTLEPYAAIDFAPPENIGVCQTSKFWAFALAAGVIARSETGIVVLDLDGDGDERTGWNIFYLHVASEDRIASESYVNAGDAIGHPSCEGRGVQANGTHIHIARKYNGEWILAGGTLAFNLDGWIVHTGSEQYLGTLTKGNKTITACKGCTNIASKITAGE